MFISLVRYYIMRIITFVDTKNADYIYLHSNNRHFKIYVTDANIVGLLKQCTYNYFYNACIIDFNLSQSDISSKILKLTEPAILNIIGYYENLTDASTDSIWYNIATLYHFIGYENYAIEAYKSCGENSDAIHNLGLLAYDKMDYDTAIRYYKVGLKMGNFNCAT